MLRFNHLNLTVADQDRAADFYQRHLLPNGRKDWMGADSLHLRDAAGSDLAFQKGTPAPAGDGSHHGFLAASASDVDALRDRLVAEGIRITDDCIENGFRSLKFIDLDGYECEVYWEAAWPPA